MQAPKNGFFYVLDRATGEADLGRQVPGQRQLGDERRPHDRQTGRGANARYLKARVGELTIPGPLGSHNWHPMAFSPETGLVYIPAHTLPSVYAEMRELPVSARLLEHRHRVRRCAARRRR